MPSRPDKERHRRSIRLRTYDYAQPGAYFVTVCTYGRGCLLGSVADGKVMLSEVGRIVDEEWRRAPLIRPYVNLDAFVIMPNHLHGVIIITDAAVGARRRLAPTNDVDSPRQFGSPPPHAVSSIIGSFKSAATRRVNRFRGSPGAPLWQRNYYEHIIRGDEELQRIRYYIECNPTQWEADRYYPAS